jgi:hypothetical protein
MRCCVLLRQMARRADADDDEMGDVGVVDDDDNDDDDDDGDDGDEREGRASLLEALGGADDVEVEGTDEVRAYLMGVRCVREGGWGERGLWAAWSWGRRECIERRVTGSDVGRWEGIFACREHT